MVVLAHYLTHNSLRQVALVAAGLAIPMPNYCYHLKLYYVGLIFEKVVRFLMLHN